MILSRLSQAIRTQNWFAVVLEFVIVVAGVLLAFQITAWNEARQEQALEAVIICRLVDDFSLIGPDVREHLSDAHRTAEQASALVRAAQEGLDLDTLGQFSTEIFMLRVPPAGSATYAQLISNGDIGLIRSSELRLALTDFGEHVDRHQRAGSDLANGVFDPGAPVFGAVSLSPAEIEALSPSQREALQAVIGSVDFQLATRLIEALVSASLSWKTTTAEKLERLEQLLAVHGAHCAGGSTP
ncbi:hypothetical protein HXX25_00415 [Hyphobacterium sp. CCMP332]|jgi:hypothetical protein|uniref:hypothetical protein n=1 Tax=Hyphobacterium sp. CCMP332 TaxID=2749086 RepID=UPI00164FA46B|nr:hypothetical protein [Hyphobacterium sp. CCMP332]QNL17928.1 hypothetical protein HXX25_00415 [Hyphobacterium sp. CCMP332]